MIMARKTRRDGVASLLGFLFSWLMFIALLIGAWGLVGAAWQWARSVWGI